MGNVSVPRDWVVVIVGEKLLQRYPLRLGNSSDSREAPRSAAVFVQFSLFLSLNSFFVALLSVDSSGKSMFTDMTL